MKIRFLAFAISVAAWMVCHASAQVTQVQTVQLPTFHFFGTSTTVVVPTQGTISMGSIGGSTRTRFDRVGSGTVGVDSFSGGLLLSATVIDLAEMDRAVLAEAARRRGADVDVLGRPVDVDRISARPIAIHPVERQRAATYLRRGRTAEAAGQPEVAKVFYRRVVKHGSAREKRIAEARLTQIESAQAARHNEKVR